MQKNNQQNNLMDNPVKFNYTLVIMGPAYGTQSSYCAYQFALALLTHSPHTIKTVFFYADGIYNANCYNDPANDEFDLTSAWQALCKKHSFKLMVCISAAHRRGITEENLARYFELTGLGELSESVDNADRVIQF